MTDDATALLHSSMPLTERLGMVARSSAPEEVVVALAWDDTLCTVGGAMHGGAVMALADSAGAVCAFLNLPDGAIGTSTIESKTNFLGAVTDGELVASSRPLHVGGSTIVVETELRCGERLVAKVTQTQAVMRPRG